MMAIIQIHRKADAEATNELNGMYIANELLSF